MNDIAPRLATAPAAAWSAWRRFWFTPTAPHTLALLRILGGAMIFYTHLVWTFDLDAFLGPQAWLPAATARQFQAGSWSWSHLWHIDSPALLWTAHLAALVVFLLLTIGLWTRPVSILACVLCLAYCHRLQGALFGLDQVNALLATYLMIGPSGAVWSVDRWLARRRDPAMPPPAPSVGANIAIRLVQLHLCVIYLFGGIGKMRGELWWDGSAVWFAIANLEYQSLDVAWLVNFPWLVALLTHVTVFWETFYIATVWPRATRGATLALAVAVHGGIALALGMITFGLAMIIVNLAFVRPEWVEAAVGRLAAVVRQRAGQGGAARLTAAPGKAR